MKEHENVGQTSGLQELRTKLGATDDNEIDWAKLEKDARKTVAKFRKKLTPEQNARWNDKDIVQAFLSLGDDPLYFESASAKQQLLDASSKALSQEPDFFQTVAQSAKLHDALKAHAIMFWNTILTHAHLAMDRGKYMNDADRGKGLLVTVGNDEISSIAAHWQENQDGGGIEFENRFEANPKRRGNFVPGNSIFSIGSGPGTEGDDDPNSETAEETARRIREQWVNEKHSEPKTDTAA